MPRPHQLISSEGALLHSFDKDDPTFGYEIVEMRNLVPEVEIIRISIKELLSMGPHGAAVRGLRPMKESIDTQDQTIACERVTYRVEDEEDVPDV